MCANENETHRTLDRKTELETNPRQGSPTNEYLKQHISQVKDTRINHHKQYKAKLNTNPVE